MVEFATKSGFDRRKEELATADRLAQAAQMQNRRFENAQQDRARADALDEAERRFYTDKFAARSVPQNQGPSAPMASPEFRTAGFNPNAGEPSAGPAVKNLVTTAQGQPDPAAYFASVPGGGKILAGIDKMQQQKEDDAERNAITALRNGNFELFDHFNTTAKLDIPQADLQRMRTDGRFRVNMGNAALAAEMYKSNEQQASAFLMAYMDAATNNPGGNPQDFVVQASNKVGPPADKPDWTIKQLVDGAMVRINENSGDVQPITMQDPSGKTIPVKGTGAKTGKDLLFQVKFDAYKKAFPNASDADALSFANGDTTLGTDPGVRATYFKIAADLLEDDIGAMDMPLEEKQALLASMTDDMMGGAGNPTLRKTSSQTPRRAAGSDQNNPVQVATQAEFDALPSGAYYVNPADGATYRKN